MLAQRLSLLYPCSVIMPAPSRPCCSASVACGLVRVVEPGQVALMIALKGVAKSRLSGHSARQVEAVLCAEFVFLVAVRRNRINDWRLVLQDRPSVCMRTEAYESAKRVCTIDSVNAALRMSTVGESQLCEFGYSSSVKGSIASRCQILYKPYEYPYHVWVSNDMIGSNVFTCKIRAFAL